MVDTYRADSSQEEFSNEPPSYDAETSRRPADTTHDLETRADARRNIDNERRRQRRSDLFSRTALSCSGFSLEVQSGT
jgi:hypothetical protein